MLAIAAEASQRDLVVLYLDEIDKAPERVEGLLLDVLQTGRVPVRPGHHIEARLDRLVVMATSNGARPLGDAFLRRCRRVRMTPIPVEVQDEIVRAAPIAMLCEDICAPARRKRRSDQRSKVWAMAAVHRPRSTGSLSRITEQAGIYRRR